MILAPQAGVHCDSGGEISGIEAHDGGSTAVQFLDAEIRGTASSG